MTSNKIHLYVLLFALPIVVAACYISQIEDVSFFSGVYPTEAESYISGNCLSLANQALEVEWSTGNGAIQLKRLTNKYCS